VLLAAVALAGSGGPALAAPKPGPAPTRSRPAPLPPVGRAPDGSVVGGPLMGRRGVVLPPDGTQRVEGQMIGSLRDAETLGQQLAHELWQRGARELLSGSA